MEQKVKLVCERCNKDFERRLAEVNRSEKLGRPNYCSLSCFCFSRNDKYGRPKGSWDHLRQYYLENGYGDEYTRFRWFLKLIKNNKRIKKFGISTLSLEDIKNLWISQKGICPITGWELELPKTITGYDHRHTRMASIDRIDCSRGYELGNIRFVSIMANFARNNFSDQELIEFCKSVAKNHGDDIAIDSVKMEGLAGR